MALLSFVDSAPRAYRLKASNAYRIFSTEAGTSPAAGAAVVKVGAALSLGAPPSFTRPVHKACDRTTYRLRCPVCDTWLARFGQMTVSADRSQVGR
jgi:hypothetical protein